MADGSVTIKANFDGKEAEGGVSRLKATLGGLSGAGQKMGSVFKSVLGANLVSGAVTSGLSLVSNGITGIISNLNDSVGAWASFEGNMRNIGMSTGEIEKVRGSLQNYAKDTIYSASEMASTYAQLRATGVEGTEDLVMALGNLAGSAENPAQAMKSLSQQVTQMTANSKVQFADFRILAQQAPAAMAEVAKKMGMTYGELTTAIKDGRVETAAFFDALKQAGAAGSVFEDMARKPKTVQQALDSLSDGIAGKLIPAYKSLTQYGISAIGVLGDIVDSFDGDALAGEMEYMIESVLELFAAFGDLGVFDNFKATLSSVGEMFRSVFKVDPGLLNTGVVTVANLLNGLMYTIQDVASGVTEFFQGFSNSGAVRALALAFFDLSEAGLDLSEKLSGAIPWGTIGNAAGQVVKFIAEIVSAIAQFSQKVDGNIFRGLLVGIPAAIAGLKAFNFLKSFNPFSFFKKNVADGVGGAGEAVKRSKSTISQVFSGLSNVIKSSGTAIKAAATGIGTGIKTALSGVGPVLRAFGAMLRTAGVANILAFGGAIGIAAVGIGAGIGIIVASFALLATQSAGISQIITTISTSLGSLASTIIGALAQAFVTIAPYLPIVATAFAQLSPLITAAGTAIASIITAFASLSPVVVAFGMAFSMVVTAIGGAVSQIIIAATPLVAVLGSVFTTTVQIVSTAIVQIVQALSPIIPAITEMVVAVAPVLQSMVEAFTTLITNLSPIIDSLTNLVTGLGDSIRNVLDGAKGVIESFGNAVSGILDSVAGVFDSIGNAALNAGKGFDLLARGIERLTGLNLLDMGASLAAAATGLAAISATGPGLAIAGAGMTALGTGMMMIGSSAMVLQTSLAVIPTILGTLQTSLSALSPSIMTAQASLMTFAVTAMSSLAGLVSAGAMVTGFAMQVTMLAPVLMLASAGLAMFNAQSNAAGSAMQRLGSASSTVLMQVTALGTGIASAMSSAVSAVARAGNQMNLSMQSSMNQVGATVRTGLNSIVSTVRTGGAQMVSAFRTSGQQLAMVTRTSVNQAVATVRSGYGAMQSAGNYIGQGLAVGMTLALGAVRAAANALVAEAERAAQAKAKINSPSHLFRDEVGWWIGLGVAKGIDNSAPEVANSLDYIRDQVNGFKVRINDVMDTSTAKLSSQLKVEALRGKTPSVRHEEYANQSNKLLSEMLDRLEILEATISKGQQIVLDTGALVGGTVDTYSDVQSHKARVYNRMRGISE